MTKRLGWLAILAIAVGATGCKKKTEIKAGAPVPISRFKEAPSLPARVVINNSPTFPPAPPPVQIEEPPPLPMPDKPVERSGDKLRHAPSDPNS